MTLIEHLESHLGDISGGWRDPNRQNPIQVAGFFDQPFKDINTYSTIGLSEHRLVTATGKYIHQELVCTAYRNFAGEKIASFLSTFADSIVSSHKALLRGDVVGPTGPVILGSLLNSVYVAVPMIFPESFEVFDAAVPGIAFLWVIPIHEDEARFVRMNGWERFDELLEEKNPELWDLHRESVV